MNDLMDLKGSVCLITGGTSGIGLATARAYVSRGAHVAVTGRTLRPDAVQGLKSEAHARGSKFLFIQADAGSGVDCRRTVEETVSTLGSVDVLVHAAGGPILGGLLQISEEDWMKGFDVHVHAIFHLCRAAVPHMVKRKRGAIILISSAAGLRGCLNMVTYAVVKGALPHFARTLARELAEHNIRVNCIAPGFITTPFHDYLTPQQVENNLKNRIPLHTAGKPEEVAEAIVLMTENDYITGESLTIDGGLTMRIV
ncbi:MAG: 3-oxoacyl-[acyl-carrier-protein] reductase [Candidatus Acidiferrum sp.]